MKNSQNLESRMNIAFESIGGDLEYKKITAGSKWNIFYKGLLLFAIVTFFVSEKGLSMW